MVLEEESFKDKFLIGSVVYESGLLTWLLMTISRSKEKYNNPWFSLDNQTVISKELSDHVYLEHCWWTNEYDKYNAYD